MFWYTYTICTLDKIMIKNLKPLYYLHRNVHTLNISDCLLEIFA